MLARMPIDKALTKVEPHIANKLNLSKELKAFASKRLGLPDNRSYTNYVALEREYPVWVVIAAPEYSLNAKHWCYLVIGCAAYRGYFSEASANRYASKLQRQGLDTHVGGASAYSTLGWFSDPLLPSMMQGSDAGFAEVLFHELAHQKLYFNGRSDFNEAFASVVGEQGALLWLRENRPASVPAYQASLQARQDFSVLIERLKTKLREVYASGRAKAELETVKQTLFQVFQADYKALKAERWQNRGYYDNWLLTPINNARLAGFSTYHTLQPKLEALFIACGSDFTRYYRRLKSNSDIDQFNDCTI